MQWEFEAAQRQKREAEMFQRSEYLKYLCQSYAKAKARRVAFDKTVASRFLKRKELVKTAIETKGKRKPVVLVEKSNRYNMQIGDKNASHKHAEEAKSILEKNKLFWKKLREVPPQSDKCEPKMDKSDTERIASTMKKKGNKSVQVTLIINPSAIPRVMERWGSYKKMIFN